MTAGDVVRSPEGEEVILVDIGQRVLGEDDTVRLWDVSLAPGEVQPWHLHHNPYLVLSLEASPGRMDWLDGSQPRFLDEYVGGSVYRPTSPVHRLTNVGGRTYRNRLVELKDLGEKRSEPVDVGPGARSIKGDRPGTGCPDGREVVLTHDHATVWEVLIPARSSIVLALASVPHVTASFVAPDLTEDPWGGTAIHPGGETTLRNDTDIDGRWFVAELSYLAGPTHTEESR